MPLIFRHLKAEHLLDERLDEQMQGQKNVVWYLEMLLEGERIRL